MVKRLRDTWLYAKFSKYEFSSEKVTFLGHMVSIDNISVDVSKVEIILD